MKLDEDLYNHIIKSRNISDEEEQYRVKEALRHNIFTVTMFSDMTGIPLSTVNNKTLIKQKKDGEIYTDLDYTCPWPSLKKFGGKFIIRNSKSEELLRK